MADSMARIQIAGPTGTKRNLAVVGDGYTAADQAAYNTYVSDTLMGEVFKRDYFYEDAQAFNVFRVNLESNDSGVTTHTYDNAGNRTNVVNRDTALDTIFTGRWNRCWMEDGPNTSSRLNAALNTWVPDWDFVLIVLNAPGFGGCRRGQRLYVTSSVSWAVVSHEFGHGFASLADEYCRPGTYTGGEPGAVNVTKNSNRNTLKWRRFVRPTTPVPTSVNPSPGSGACTNYNVGTRPSWWASVDDAGLFEGARYNDKGIYRPVENCRMRGNTPDFCPVCYTEMKRVSRPSTGHSFNKVYCGDFNGDGREDILVHNGNSIQIYRSHGNRFEFVSGAVERVPGSWQFRSGDQFFVGDFNGDGKDEVVVYNATNWSKKYLGLLADDGADGLQLVRRYRDSVPGWAFGKNDQFHAADFDGDGRKDLVVFNGTDWSIPYLAMLRSNGTSFTSVRRYDASLAGWQMKKYDKILPGDFTGDGKDDLYIFNGRDWSTRYLTMLRSNGTSYTQVKRYDNSLAGWSMQKDDTYHVGDFNGDGKDDLYVFNGANWSKAYLAMMRSNGSSLTMAKRYDGNAPGWNMRRNDRHFPCDVDGNGTTDLFVYNHQDWSTQYLGTMKSTGSGLTCAWKADWVGEWNLGSVDRFEVSNYEGRSGPRNLVIHNANWLGMLRAAPMLSLQRIYYQWIHNYNYGRNW